MEFKKSLLIILILVVGAGVLSTIISKNDDLMGLLIYSILLFAKNVDQQKISEIVFLVSKSWFKFTLLVIFIYILAYVIKNFDTVTRHPSEFLRDIKHGFHSIKEKMKYASKIHKFREAHKSKYSEVVSVRVKDNLKLHDKDMLSIKKSRAWPEDASTKNKLIKEKIEEIVHEKGNFTVTEVMKSIEKKFNLSIKEKHQIIDDIRSVVSSSFRLTKLKNKNKEVKI